MTPIRIGIIGSGGMAERNAERFAQTEGFCLTAIAARNPQTGPALAAKHGVECLPHWQRLLDRADIDAIAICTNNDSHGPIVLTAMDAGKHVFCEYPVARTLTDLHWIAQKIDTAQCVLRVSHDEPLSAAHRALKQRVAQSGDLIATFFTRLTPGRGARPEMLFNLPASGPPALFFVYHIYPFIDLFGPASWVEAGARYIGLRDDGRYDAFVNAVTIGFRQGGIGQWTWAGGIDIEQAEEHRRIAMTGGAFIHTDRGWRESTRERTIDLPPAEPIADTQQTRFLKDIRGDTAWRAVARTAIDDAHVGLAAEQSIAENRRIAL